MVNDLVKKTVENAESNAVQLIVKGITPKTAYKESGLRYPDPNPYPTPNPNPNPNRYRLSKNYPQTRSNYLRVKNKAQRRKNREQETKKNRKLKVYQQREVSVQEYRRATHEAYNKQRQAELRRNEAQAALRRATQK